MRIVNTTFEQGVGIERALIGKGWSLERSMMCSHMDGNREEWKQWGIDEKLGDMEKKA